MTKNNSWQKFGSEVEKIEKKVIRRSEIPRDYFLLVFHEGDMSTL